MQIQGSQQAAQPGLDNLSNTVSAQALTGKAANGEKVAVQTNASSPLAKAADMAEEIVQFVKDNRSKNLNDRDVKKGSQFKEDMQKRVEKIQTIQNVQEIKDFLQQLKSNPNLTREQLHEKLKEAFDDDVVHEFMGLDSAVRFFDDIGDEDKTNLVKSVRNELFAENKTAIVSALNISEQAAEEALLNDFSNTRELRETHVKLLDHVRDNATLEISYDKLLDSHSSKDFKKAVDIQAKLASTDLLSFNPSTSSERLKAVIDDLAELKVLVGLHDGCVETEEQIKRIFPEASVEERVLMKQMLKLLNLPMPTESDFSKIPDKLQVTELEAQIFTMTKVVNLVRMLPEEIFSNIESKQNMLAAATESLDYLIEQESEEEIGDVVDAGDGGFGILGDIGIDVDSEDEEIEPVDSVAEVGPEMNAPEIEPEVVEPLNQRSSPKPAAGTAAHIAAKALNQIPGEEYSNLGEIAVDIQKLSGNPAELQALLDMIEEAKDSGADFDEDDLKFLEDHVRGLLQISKPQSGLHQTNPRSINVRGN